MVKLLVFVQDQQEDDDIGGHLWQVEQRDHLPGEEVGEGQEHHKGQEH